MRVFCCRDGFVCDGEQAQPQGVQHDADARQAHRRRADHRRELHAEGGVEYARRERNADDVVEERPEEVLLDVTHDAARKADGGDSVEEVAPHEHRVCAVDGDIRARTDGNAEICLYEGGRVVHAVTDHGDAVALPLQPLHMGALFCGKNPRDHLCDAEPCGNCPCRALVVARQHDGGEVHRLHLRDCRGARRLLCIAHAEEADDASRVHDDERRLATLCHLGAGFLHGGRNHDAKLRQQRRIPCGAVRIRHTCTHALAEHRRKIRCGRAGEPLLRSIARDRVGNRVLAALLKGGGKRDEVIGRNADGADADELRTALGERARFIHQYGINAARRLKRRPRLDEDAVRRAAPRADHDSDGCCKPERTGAGDDENGDRDGECELHACAHHEPDRARHEGNRNHDGDKDRRNAVGKVCNRCL